jgi:hypothetical protein
MAVVQKGGSMRLLRVMLVIFAIGISNSASAVSIRGPASCGRWVKDRAEPNKPNVREEFDKTWLLGFLSGLTAASNIDVLKDPDVESLYLWMDNYCKAHPLDGVDDGAGKLFDELAKRTSSK